MTPHRARHTGSTVAILLTAALVAAAPALSPPSRPGTEALAVRLTGTDSLGNGTALIMGPSGFPIPVQRYVDAMTRLYLQPHGFAGTARGLFTPEGLYPATGVKTLPFDVSAAQGQQILASTIQSQLAAGGAGADSAANPVVVVGFSQSSSVSSSTMQQLAAEGVPSDYVHFVLTGDPNNPNGGMLERFNVPINGESPSVPSLGITFNGATPDNLYPTAVYTNEYDGFADFPRYPVNLLSDLNAFLGIAYSHATYAVLTPAQIADAILLPGSAELTGAGLTDYYMIPAETLPLLAPLQLLPVIGEPLYDLLEPDTRILVNLGYGSIEHGWDQGPANVPTPFGVFPTVDPAELFGALASGLQQGVIDALQTLRDPANYQIPPLLENPSLASLMDAAYVMGLIDHPGPTLLELLQGGLGRFANFPISDATLLSPPTDIFTALTGTVAADYATLLPVADTANALLTTLPSVAVSFITDQLAAGDLLGAISEPIAVATALIPFALIFGAGAPIVEAAGGTLANLIQLFDLG